MPYPEKSRQKQVFIEGINSDLARELHQHKQAKYILNCHIRSTNGGNEGIVTNVKGNVLITTSLPAGVNKTIGTALEIENNKFLFFVFNDLGYHTFQLYDEVPNTVTKVFESITDSSGIDILRFSPLWPILMADYVDGKVYFVDGLNNARKFNLAKLLDKTVNGYGPVVLETFFNAYKRTAIFAPTAKYFSDTSKPFNRFYGQIQKFAQDFIYMDNEYSVVSDWSAVVIPDKEPSQGVNSIPTNNNGIEVEVETGSHEVTKVRVLMQHTLSDVDDVEGILNWKIVATLDKKKLGLADNSTYKYRFYNDEDYPVISATQVIQPQSFMMKRPRCQSVAKHVLTYSNGYIGFPVVDVNASIEIAYSDLFLPDATENKYNEPLFTYEEPDVNYVGSGTVVRYDGTPEHILFNQGPYRFTKQKLTIGFDVKKGNNFILIEGNGFAGDQFNISQLATSSDSSLTIANAIKQTLINTGRIYRQTPAIADTNIYNNTVDGSGNVSFSFIIKASRSMGYIQGNTSVAPVQYNTLKDLGVSVKNEKMGTRKRLYYEYIDFDGRKSALYTSDALIEAIQPENVAGKKLSTIRLITNHLPPIEAEYWQVVRSEDLNSKDFIQILVQKVVDVPTDNTSQYLDLVIGSLFTYQKLHPNTTLDFQPEKGDRISLKKKTDDDTYYPFFETEVLQYRDVVTDRVTDRLVTDGTAIVAVTSASSGNVGKFILLEDGSEREIVSAGVGTYTLNNIIGDVVTDKIYNYYDLVDRRGTIRIRKPATTTVVMEDMSIIEIYKPSRSASTSETGREFQQKYPIINSGTANAYHGGNIQNQTASQPSIVEFSGGTIYVRSREMPINNIVPGTQVLIAEIEDPNSSDFYPSLMTDDGRVNSLDKGQGVVQVGSRTQFSATQIENTLVNGFNNFRNLDREDFNDDYGDTMLTKFEQGRIIIYKQLRTGFCPVEAVLTQDAVGRSLLVSSGKFLNPISYYAWEGGIGDNPESWASNGNQKYYVSTNSGVIIRFGGNGEEPISRTFFLDSDVRALLADAVKNKAKIWGGFDREYDYYIVTIEGYNKYIYFDGFTGWIVDNEPLDEDIVFEVVTPPVHGDFDIVTRVYTPDADYIGPDPFSYRAFINGEWTAPKNICITVVEELQRPTAWRAKEGSYFCVRNEDDEKIGYKGWATLEEYYVDDNSLTGNEKPNIETDADYLEPIYAPDTCVPDVTVYYSVEKSAGAFRNDCDPGETGTWVVFVVAAGAYSSTIDQATADAAAQAAAEAGAQANANSLGDCEVPSGEDYYVQVVDHDLGGDSHQLRGELRDVDNNPVTVTVDVNFNWTGTSNLLPSGPSSSIFGNATILAGTSNILIGSPVATYDETFSDLHTDTIVPSIADGHNLNVT